MNYNYVVIDFWEGGSKMQDSLDTPRWGIVDKRDEKGTILFTGSTRDQCADWAWMMNKASMERKAFYRDLGDA